MHIQDYSYFLSNLVDTIFKLKMEVKIHHISKFRGIGAPNNSAQNLG